MIEAAYSFLKDNDLNISDLSRKTGVSTSTLSYTFKHPMKTWKFIVFQALAKATHTTPSRVVSDLQSERWHLDINDKTQSIQGYKISSSALFQKVKFIVMNEYFEGWQPNYHDIKRLVYNSSHPSQLVKRALRGYLKDAKNE